MRPAAHAAGRQPALLDVAPLPSRVAGASFCRTERHLLLVTQGIGQAVLERIESAGVCSLQQLRDIGVDVVVDRICGGVGSLAWRNRRRALLRALASVAATPGRFHTLSD